MKPKHFPVPCEKNAHSDAQANASRRSPLPRHLNVVAQTLRDANGNVRFFRTGGGPPLALSSTLKFGGPGGTKHICFRRVCVFSHGTDPYMGYVRDVKQANPRQCGRALNIVGSLARPHTLFQRVRFSSHGADPYMGYVRVMKQADPRLCSYALNTVGSLARCAPAPASIVTCFRRVCVFRTGRTLHGLR